MCETRPSALPLHVGDKRRGGLALPSLLARPKSMSLILVPVLLTHMMFSGLRSRWTMPCLWMYSTPSEICFMYLMHSRSVSSKSSSMMRSNSSPPDTLWEQKGAMVRPQDYRAQAGRESDQWRAGSQRDCEESRGYGGAGHFLQLPESQATAPLCWSWSSSVQGPGPPDFLPGDSAVNY